MQPKKITIPQSDTAQASALSRELNMSLILAQLLINRGIKTAAQAEKFLNAKLSNFTDPFLLGQMKQAVGIIQKHLKDKNKIMVFGDYDADGITSVAVLKNTFKKMGQDVLHYLPHRVKEGYGLAKNILDICRQNQVRLLITADCGTANVKEVGQLRQAGIEVVITDHHQPSGSGLPDASALINPKVNGNMPEFNDLAGVGVSFKLCQALTRDYLEDDLDLVCLGTIADVVALTGENRIIAKLGLAKLGATKKAGLRALIESSRIQNKKITSTFISYILAPRLNASGRMDTPESALRLLLTEDMAQANELAKALETLNRQRQQVESKIIQEAESMIASEVNFKDHRVIVVAAHGWHKGVLGVVASKLADRFYRPTVVISLDEDICRGSGRSIKNFHLFDALKDCAEFLYGFGGHAHAVGLSITKENIQHFRKKINQYAWEKLAFEDLLPDLGVDMELGLSDLREEVIAELELLSPHGAGNPEPLFYTRGLKLKGQPQVLARDTLKFWVTDGKKSVQAIGFGMSRMAESLLNAPSFNLVYTPRFDSWQATTSIILEAKDIFCEG